MLPTRSNTIRSAINFGKLPIIITDIYWVIDYKLSTILLLQQYQELHGMGHHDSAKAPENILKIYPFINNIQKKSAMVRVLCLKYSDKLRTNFDQNYWQSI